MLAKLNLPTGEWMSVLKGTLIAAAGAALTYAAQAISGMDFGTATPMIVAGLSIVVNMLRKVLGNNPDAAK